MLTMDQIHHIRALYYEQGYNISEIAEATGRDWKTVAKYIDMAVSTNRCLSRLPKRSYSRNSTRTRRPSTAGWKKISIIIASSVIQPPEYMTDSPGSFPDLTVHTALWRNM